jgi:hypothetical protein
MVICRQESLPDAGLPGFTDAQDNKTGAGQTAALQGDNDHD